MASHTRPRSHDDDLVSAVLDGGGPALRDLFAAQGARAPLIHWSPRPQDLNNPAIQGFAKTCRAMTDATRPMACADYRFDAFEPHTSWMMVLEVEDSGTAFRYSHYGEGIARVRGLSMLGQTTADFGGHIGRFFTATYRAMVQRREWLLTDHVPPKEVFARVWERLIVPVVDESGTVARFVAMNVPDNDLRAGLEIVPDAVMVLDADQIVRYANTAARRMFDRNRYPSQDLSLFDYAGIDLQLDQPPGDLVHSRAVQDRVCLAARDNILQDFLVTISGARLWGHDFYVITLRQDMRAP